MTAKYEFQGCLYRGERAMLDAIAETWLRAGGQNSDKDVAEALAQMTDAQLANECIEGWELDVDERNGLPVSGDEREDDEYEDLSHMGFNQYAKEDLAAAFARFRARC